MKQDFLSNSESKQVEQHSIAPGEIIIGLFNGLSSSGLPLVDYYGNLTGQSIQAISTVALTQQHAGRQVALLFAEGDMSKPVIIGLIHSPLQEMLETFELTTDQQMADDIEDETDQKSIPDKLEDVSIDGRRVVVEGKEEIVFKCGEASITLTKAGKILIRGKYLLTRSTGVNRIMGGSVQVN